MTIANAISQVMQQANKPLTAKDTYNLIKAEVLYEFKAKNPQSIVSNTIRKHLKGLENKNSSAKKLFEETSRGFYRLIE